jgi:HlyD family secretion protein
MKHSPLKLIRHPLSIAIAATLTALMIGSIAGVAGNSEAQDAKAKPKTETPAKGEAQTKAALTVTLAKPQRQTVTNTFGASGNIAAWQEASIGSMSNGLQLIDVRVNVGDSVRRGQVLAVFDAEPVRAEVAQAEATLAEAQASQAAAQADNERAKTLKDSGALSVQQIAQFETAARTAGARLQSAQALVRSAKLKLKYATLTAADDGIISARTATVGSVVPGGMELFRMIRQGRLEWRAEVLANQLSNVKVGAVASLVAANGTKLEGKVRMIAPTVDPQTRTALVYVDLPKGSVVSAGMAARGDFAQGDMQVTTIPQTALVVRDGTNFVYVTADAVVGSQTKATQTKVTIGRRVGDRIEIVGGLPTGASVVESGAGFLSDGDTVKVVATTQKTPSAAPTTKS